MAYPRQPPRGGYNMPMPQYSQNTGTTAPYPAYGQHPQYPPPARQPYPQTYQHQPASQPQHGMPYPPSSTHQRTPYSSTTTSQPPYPVATSHSPYPTSQVQSMSVNSTTTNSSPYPSSGSTNQFTEVDQWMENATNGLLAIIKEEGKTELENLVNNENRIIELVQDTNGVCKTFSSQLVKILSNIVIFVNYCLWCTFVVMKVFVE